jgi:DnaJ-class molecular chaperone
LKNISEPILITIYSLDSFPSINKIYIDDDDVTHEIEIKIKIIKNELFTYKIINNKINIYYKLKYNLYDYLNGYTTRIKYIDDEYIDINIPKFISKKYEIKDKGINGGSLIIKIKLRNSNINIDNWNKLEDTEKDNFNKILFRIL